MRHDQDSPYDRTAALYDLVYELQGKDYRAEADELLGQIRAHCPRARSLLDVACGTGRHLHELAPHFDDLAGVDLSEGMLAVARDRLGDDVELVHADMRDFDLGRRFDAVTSMFSAIGYAADTDEPDATVASMADHLAPDGVMAVDGWVRPEAWKGGPNPATGDADVVAGASGPTALARFARTRTDGRHTWVEMALAPSTPAGVELFDDTHRLTLFGSKEYVQAFARAGLSVEVVARGDRDRYIATWATYDRFLDDGTVR